MGLHIGRGVGETPRSILITEAHSGWSKGWAAKLNGIDNDAPGGIARTFLNDYTHTLSRSGNGHKEYVITEDGLYEAASVYRSFREYRVLFAVEEERFTVLATTEGVSMGEYRRIAKEHLAGGASA